MSNVDIEISNNKRIAKNTLLLYGRMLFLMIVSLFTSRVILQSLGVEDFGIYNVVGGVIVVFSFLSSSFSAAISRFLTYDLGLGDTNNLKKTFSTSVTIQLLFALLIIFLAETIGLWFLNEKLVIPEDRMYAANWVYQLSIATFTVNLISVPYNATIISHEKMSAFAYVSIVEAIGKLIIAFGTFYSTIDKLIFYAAAMFGLSLVIRFIYGCYCKKYFEECTYRLEYDKTLFKNIFSFAGWNTIGVFSAVVRDQGGNILINLFFGPAINAARSVAMQVNTVIYGFVSNFMTALNPQITKNYANGNRDYMMKLIFQGSRYSFYIMLFISLPVMINADYLLDLWLTEVPDHSVNFVRLILIFNMNELLAGPLYTSMLATGNTRNYQIVVGGCQTLNLPISYFALKSGVAPEGVFVISIIIGVCCELLRVFMLRGMIGLNARAFLKEVYLNVIIVTIIASIIPVTLKLTMPQSILSFMLLILISIVCVTATVYLIGFGENDRLRAKYYMRNLINKINTQTR